MTILLKLWKFVESERKLRYALFTGFLGGCNPTNELTSTSEALAQQTINIISGAVVKGPLQGALVYADSNNDGIGDGDPVMTGADGSYSIYSDNPNASIIAVTSKNTVDTSSGETLPGITLKAPPGSLVVTPATTILEAQPDIDPTQLAVALGIPTTDANGTAIDLTTFNPYAIDVDPAAALAVEKASQQVMVTIQAVSAAAEGAGMESGAAFEQAMSSVAAVVSETALSIDISSKLAITEAQKLIELGEIDRIDFSGSRTLAEITKVVQEKVAEATQGNDNPEIDERALYTILDQAMVAVENVNTKIAQVAQLGSEASMGVFATATEVTSEIKAATVAEAENPGSGLELVTFTDAAKVDAAAKEAALIVLEKIEAADLAFERIYEEFLGNYSAVDADLPDSIGDQDQVEKQDDIVGEMSIKDAGDDEYSDELIDGNDTLSEESLVEGITDRDSISSDDGDTAVVKGGGGGGGGGGAATIAPSPYQFIKMDTGTTKDEKVLDLYVNIERMEAEVQGYMHLFGYEIYIIPKAGWDAVFDDVSPGVGFSWSNSFSGPDSVVSVNNSTSNSMVGKIVFLSGSDISEGQPGILNLGSVTLNGNDIQIKNGIEITVQSTFSGINGVTVTENIDYTIYL